MWIRRDIGGYRGVSEISRDLWKRMPWGLAFVQGITLNPSPDITLNPSKSI